MTTSLVTSISEPPISDLVLSMDKTKQLSAFIKCTDEDEHLLNFCYSNDTPSTPEETELFNENVDFIKQVRGLVVDKSNNIVMSAFNYTSDHPVSEIYSDIAEKFYNIGSNDKQNQTARVNEGIEKCRFFKCHEGALVRMFWHKEKW